MPPGVDWLFSHEAGHCLGAMHYRAYCPPGSEWETIETPSCGPTPSGGYREKEPFYSNPNVMYEGLPTGTESNNNAKAMTERRFQNAAAGTNCLDGNPNEAWMKGDEIFGKIGNNCPNGESSFKPSLKDSLGKISLSLGKKL